MTIETSLDERVGGSILVMFFEKQDGDKEKQGRNDQDLSHERVWCWCFELSV